MSFFKDKRPFVPKKKDDYESFKADLIWQTLEKNYAEEIKEIHQMQAQDMAMDGKISSITEAKMNAFLDKVVEDNKKYGRT
jgi:hypothetical protein